MNDTGGGNYQKEYYNEILTKLLDTKTNKLHSNNWDLISFTALSNHSTFTNNTDEIVGSGLCPFSKRVKTVHKSGIVAKVKWICCEKFKHKYTGLFSQNNKYGILRFSTNSNDTPNGINKNGIALKFIQPDISVDTESKSYNLICFQTVVKTTEKNFLKQSFSNITTIPIKIDIVDIMTSYVFNNKYKEESKFNDMLGLSSCAKTSNFSKPPKFPFRLVLVASTKNISKIDESQESFPLQKLVSTKLFNRKKDDEYNTLFDIYAHESPTHLSPDFIGKIVLKSNFFISTYGDETLFFQHTKFEDDLEYYPEWIRHL